MAEPISMLESGARKNGSPKKMEGAMARDTAHLTRMAKADRRRTKKTW